LIKIQSYYIKKVQDILGPFFIELFLFFLFIVTILGCSSELKNENKIVSITKKVQDNKKELSFFVWDGISNYNSVISRLVNFDNPTIYLNPLEENNNTFIKNTQKLHSYNSNVWYLTSAISDYPSDEYLQNQINTIVNYNKNNSQDIIGMSFDFEPWIKFTDQNNSNNKNEWADYLNFMKKAKIMLKKENLNISIVIPFWLNTITEAFPNNRPINYDIIDIADEVIVMAYTTNNSSIIDYAKNSLKYAEDNNKSIKIALEILHNSNPRITFYDNPEDIKEVIYTDINYTSFNGYIIHTLDGFNDSNITINFDNIK